MELPLQELLIPFEAVALPKARVVLRDDSADGIGDQQLLAEFAYAVDRKAKAGERKVFFAERYGGLGIFNNGGGVRCGLTGNYLVKGIGLNPLLGRSTPSAYKSGAMSGIEAIREFVWSGLIRKVLPYGAASVIAVIDAGVDFEANGKARYRRHLIARETRLRLAHLERASHFQPRWKLPMLHDAERTTLALESFAGAKLSDASPAAVSQLYDRLEDIAARHGEQLACAKIRRLSHGALSSSNVAIDGGWLDFGSISSQADYVSDPNFRLGFWKEFEYLLDALKNICHIIELYSYGKFAGEDGFNRL